MKKKFKMENLDCANCAAKMEAAINKIPGVKSATVA
ncbi:MAG TPA: heavy metal transporter, partial [Lachnospiraceae bacterium]|nr:heavy metal transporter [Lachnospiraceae bacterium]